MQNEQIELCKMNILCCKKNRLSCKMNRVSCIKNRLACKMNILSCIMNRLGCKMISHTYKKHSLIYASYAIIQMYNISV